MRRAHVFIAIGAAVLIAPAATTASAAGTVGSGVTSISAPVLVTVNGGNGYGDRPRNETTIAVDPTDPNVVYGGANDYIVGDSSCGTYISTDGGISWQDSILPGQAFGVVPTVPLPGAPTTQLTPQVHSRYDLGGDAGIALDSTGNAYYLCLVANRPEDDGSIFVSTARKGTLSFNRSVQVDTGITPIVFNDKPSIAVDQSIGGAHSGEVYVFYTKFLALNATLILESHSTDQGRTFSTPQVISTLSQASASGTSAGVGPDGHVYVAYENDTNNPCAYQACEAGQASEIDVQVSTDGGATYSAPQKAVDDVPGQGSLQHNTGRDNSFPSLVVDHGGGPYSGRVYLAWTDYTSGNADIRFSSSADGSKTWTKPKKLNDDNPDNPAADHAFPGLAVAPDGFLAADWPIDQRDDPVNGHFRAYYTESRDGGATFSKNAPLSPTTSNPNDTDFKGAFIGDYNGITADNSAVHPLWVAMREDDPTKPDTTRHEVLYTNLMPRGTTAVVAELPGVARLLALPTMLGLAAIIGTRSWLARRRRRAWLGRI